MEPLHPLWANWLNENINKILQSGISGIHVPEYLPHPKNSGFKQITLAEKVGQIRDYVLSLKDQSRLHIHEYQNGALKIHRDKHDPDVSITKALMHFFTETKSANFVMISAAVLLTIYALKKPSVK